jgi:hypothetical protein
MGGVDQSLAWIRRPTMYIIKQVNGVIEMHSDGYSVVRSACEDGGWSVKRRGKSVGWFEYIADACKYVERLQEKY